MSYIKHNFASGDILLASDLNAMEDQIAENEQTGSDLQSALNVVDTNVIALTGEVVQMSIGDYIIGTYHYVDNGQMKTTTQASRMCYKSSVHLMPGDIVWIDYRLDAQFGSLVYTTDGGSTYIGSNRSSPMVVSAEGDYYISVRYQDGRTLTTENSLLLANGVKLLRGSGNNAVVDASNWAKEISIGRYPNYKNEQHLLNMLIDSSTYAISNNVAHKSLWVKLFPNTTYTITQRLQIAGADAPRFALFNEEPKVGSVGINYISGTSNAKSFSCTFKTTNDYIFAFLKYYTGTDAAVGASVLDSITISISGVVTEETQTSIDNAKHTTSGTAKPLSIVHFSDIHADRYALMRIVEGADNIIGGYDDAICTGDMASNTGGSIESWWDANVLACIGNHDSATYTNGAYNWTGISMADRDAYYIAPFEINWGITHTAGTSYYYKDYADQKVRLIVMDVMLYNDNGAEATAQTAWLEGLLADAITNNLHVLIAIHAPHGGATPKDCSFSKYNQGVMPTKSDCNTPQAVIDAVSAKITAGLNFIGYIVGHTHQDNIWDADGDGKQLMYCITCAAVAQTAQWKNSDQNRQPGQDAYNVLVIDTNKTLVKIIRCGGADIDDHMRTRKAICFDYSTGQIVGEVL